jgi:hypothetical protein
MNLLIEPRRGYAFLTEGGDIDELAQELNRNMIPHIPQPMEVPKVRGAVKAFWFSWSNGQAAWDATAWKDFPWHLDGSGFFLFLSKTALSPLNKLWSATEMNYVARKLTNHPGYASSPESASGKRRWASRVASRYLQQRTGAKRFHKPSTGEINSMAEEFFWKLLSDDEREGIAFDGKLPSWESSIAAHLTEQGVMPDDAVVKKLVQAIDHEADRMR